MSTNHNYWDEEYNPFQYSHVVDVEGDDYLVQGRIDDELVVIRSVDSLLECEHDSVQQMMGELEG